MVKREKLLMKFLLSNRFEWNLNNFPKDFAIKWVGINSNLWEELSYNLHTMSIES